MSVLHGTLPAAAVGAACAARVGQSLRMSRRFTADDVAAFAKLSGDWNPVHTDAQYAAATRYGRPIVHGLLYASMIGTMFAARVHGAVYVSQSLRFRAPVFVDDLLEAEILVQQVKRTSRLLICATSIRNEAAQLVLTGEAVVQAPQLDDGDAIVQ